ncbi:MAG: MFS transporter [Oligoflexia bacterium]|nr:MFS transporter [Oligoflexia bacterium]
METNQLSLKEKIGYGMGDFASNIVFQSVMVFMTYYYTDIFGLAPAAVGTLFLAVRVIDAITDPLMGSISDHTKTKWGKYRPYLLWMAIPYAFTCVLTFTAPNWSYTGKLFYAYVTYNLLMLMYTAINVPYCSLGGVITDEPKERVSLNGIRFFLVFAAGMVVSATTLPLVDWLGGGDKAKGYQLAMMILGAVSVLAFWVCFATTRERINTPCGKQSFRSFLKDYKNLISNDQWFITAILNLILLIFVVMRGSVTIYYINWFVKRTDLTSVFLTLGYVFAMIGAITAPRVTKFFSKKWTYFWMHIFIAIASVWFYFISPESIVLIFILNFVIQVLLNISIPILWAMIADSADYGEWKNGERNTGLIFAGALFFLKLGLAIGGAAVGWMLAYFGYAGTATTQTPEAIHGIVLLFTIIPAVGHILLALLVTRYKLTEEFSEKIKLELKEVHKKCEGQV